MSDNRYTHLRDRMDRRFVVTADELELAGNQVLERLVNLPDVVESNPELLAEIQEITLVAAGSVEGKIKTKPDRMKNKVKNLVELLHDKDILEQLNMQLSPPEAGRTIQAIESALGYWRSPRQHSGEPVTDGVLYKPVALDSAQLAVYVRDALMAQGIAANTSKTGALVRILEAIRKATGFKTNSEEAARLACGSKR